MKMGLKFKNQFAEIPEKSLSINFVKVESLA